MLLRNKLLFLFIICHLTGYTQTNRFTISGFVKDAASNEVLIGASIAAPKYKTGTVSNAYGFFSLTIPNDSVEIIVTYIGYKPKAYKLFANQNTFLQVYLSENTALNEVVINADEAFTKNAEQTRMSVIEIPIQQIKDIPALLGEKDVLKVIQLLPGVQNGGEGNSGIYVRGGGPDQNLIILDDAVVYNAFHLFGFFSLFNGDALKNVELTKGGFPARYGGRLSSVIDMRMKDGNSNTFKGEAGIGLISSRLLFEGPIKKGKSSFIVSGRRTYIDALIQPFMSQNNYGGYYFYDLNAKANYEINDKNRLYVSGYFGRDKFYFGYKENAQNKNESNLSWGNATATIRWNHVYSPKLFSNTSAIFSNYNFGVSQDYTFDGNKFFLSYTSGITDFTLKHDLDYRPNNSHNIKAGVQVINHWFYPSAFVLKDDFTGDRMNKRILVPSFENALYLEDDIKVGSKIRLNPGIRLSHFYANTKNYFFVEPRFNSSYNLSNNLALKVSVANMNQFVHLLSNTGVGLPTDLWIPSSNKIKPQNSWQIAGGVAKDIPKHKLNISVEGYYKTSSNIIAYKEGASFLDVGNDFGQATAYDWERNITSGRGWSYGAEFLIQKKQGRLNGWIGYTLSWTQMQFDEINFGQKFWARYDRRHDISIVGIYEIKKLKPNENGIKLSATWVYGTGNAITLPVAEFIAPIHTPGQSLNNNSGFLGEFVSEYTGRNQFRMAPFHRLDLGIQFVKQNLKTTRTWEISVYNLYNRFNPYFYYIGYENNFGLSGRRVLKQVSLFPILPSISYHIKF